MWLRYLYGAPMSREWHATMARYVLPLLTLLLVALLLSVRNSHPAVQQPDSLPAVVLGAALVALLVWLVVEVGRYSARQRGASHGNRLYSRIPPPRRRAKLGRGKHRTW